MDVAGERSHKVTPRHLRRQAYLCIRQSTLRQVVENTESTERQYALRHRAVALGWPIEHVVVIDRDLGQSGASAADREGLQQLVRDVGLGRAGLVMGLEVSRLARNSTDWHRLLAKLGRGNRERKYVETTSDPAPRSRASRMAGFRIMRRSSSKRGQTAYGFGINTIHRRSLGAVVY